MRRPLARPLALLGALAVTTTIAGATDLYVGSTSTLFWHGDSQSGGFQALGACGGAIQSIGEDFQTLWLGDVGGVVYEYDPVTSIASYAFDAPNNAEALIVQGGALWIGGDDAKVHEVDKRDGTLLRTMDAQFAVSALLLFDGWLYAGSPLGVVHRADPSDGVFSFWGTCGGPVNSLASDGTHLLIGDTGGVVYRLDLQTAQVTNTYALSNDATAMAMDGADLLVSGTDGTIVRVDPSNGAVVGSSFNLGFVVSAMALGAPVEPGWPYCYGISCPCSNDDVLGGCSNHTGVGAKVSGTGTAGATADDLALTISGLPPGGWAVAYMGSTPNEAPFGDGLLCTAGGGYPVFRFPAQNSGPAGTVTLGPGIVAHSAQHFAPQGGEIFPGSTWIWQVWYRNPAGPCGNGFNTSNGYVVTFGP